MYLIKLTDLCFKAPVGLYPEEKVLGTDLILHIEIEMQQDYDPLSSNYVDYSRAYQIISETLHTGFDLLEQAAEAILQKLFLMNDEILRILICLEKIHPPISDMQGKVSVTFSKSR